MSTHTQKTASWRIGASEATVASVVLALVFTIASVWLTKPAAVESVDSEALLSAALALGLVGMLFAYFRYLRLESREWQMARARYEARALHAQEADLLEITLAHMNQGIAFVDSEGKLLIFNKRAVEYSGAEGGNSGLSNFTLPIDIKDIFLAQWKNGEFGPNGELLPEDVRQYYFHGNGPTSPSWWPPRRPPRPEREPSPRSSRP